MYEEKMTNPIVKESTTVREINTLAKSISELLAQCDHLEVRLTCVLGPQLKSDEPDTPEESMSPIPNEIRQNRKNIDAANYILRSIISRLEI